MMVQQLALEQLKGIKKLVMQLSDEQISTRLAVLHDATLGMHLRHILEFYQCLLEGVESGSVNYDLRQRDKRLEESVAYCTTTTDIILEKLVTITVNEPLQLQANGSSGDAVAPIRILTNFNRELYYNVEHCVHHLAIIKIGISAMDDGPEVAEDMGVAASTIRNRRSCAQ